MEKYFLEITRWLPTPPYARCGAGEKVEIASKPYLLLSSGDYLTPSREDISITKRIKEAGKIVGINLLDHLIIYEDKFMSMNEHGYID